VTIQQKKPIERAEEAELRDFAELVLQMDVAASTDRADLVAKIRTAWPADYIFVDAAGQPAAGEDGQDEAVKPEPQARLTTADSRGDPKWTIRIASTELAGGKDPVPVSVNGRNVVIQRGVEVEVPHRYVESLRNAVRVSVSQEPKTQEFTFSAFTNYPFEVIERPSRAEIEAFHERTKDLVLA
jgi:hypothetical protein